MQRLLAPLDRDLQDQVATASFFPGLSAADRADARRTTLPFAFNLPVVVFARAAAPPGIDQFVLTAEELRRLGEEYVTRTPARLTHIGFSPLWDVDLVYYLAQSFGAGFAATADGHVNIDDAAVAQAVAAARDWIRSSHGDIAGEREFTDTYFHRPLYQLVLEGRVRMYLSDIASFALLPESKRELLDFRWLALEGGIPVLEGYSSFAIPMAGGNAAGARLFLSWIFQPEIQARLLETAAFKRLRGFGLAGGFPVLREISERILPRTPWVPHRAPARCRPAAAAATGAGLLGRGQGTGGAAMAARRGRRRRRIRRPPARPCGSAQPLAPQRRRAMTRLRRRQRPFDTLAPLRYCETILMG